MVNTHYCTEHQTKFYRNEKTSEDGKLDIWYSHKKADGSGFCNEKNIKPELSVNTNQFDPMLACNAMNNAVALANAGKIELDKIGAYYKKLYSELTVA